MLEGRGLVERQTCPQDARAVEASLSGLYLDIVLVGVVGIAVGAGLTTHHEVEAHTNRALIARARRVVVVADSSKIGQIAFARICGLEAVHEVIPAPTEPRWPPCARPAPPSPSSEASRP